MDIPESELKVPEIFPFPFNPYPIQKDLMRSLYTIIEDKRLGIIESPTGTGKSMSLICGSLKWLLDAQKRVKIDVQSKIKELDEETNNGYLGINWLENHAKQLKIKQDKDRLREFLNKIQNLENRIEEIEKRAEMIKPQYSVPLIGLNIKNNQETKNKKIIEIKKKNVLKKTDEDKLLLNDFNVLSENNESNGSSSNSEDEATNEEKYYGIKIFLCSRTHSQLSQLVKEVKKSPFKDLKIRVVPLASRQSYCINESVTNLKYLPLINEKCQDLRDEKKGLTTKKSKTGCCLKKLKTKSGCPFLEQGSLENLKTKVLTEIHDIESLVESGKKLNACPYYASRHAVDEAQLIIVPYNIILHKATRIACGINLKNSIVIIDEAHNLLDTITNIYSCLVTGQELISSQAQLISYKKKYGEKLSPINFLHLNQLIFIITRLLKSLQSPANRPSTSSTDLKTEFIIETLAEFLLSCEIDTINLYKLLEFVTKTNLINKVRKFVDTEESFIKLHVKEKGVSGCLKTLTAKKEYQQPEEENEEAGTSSGKSLLGVISFIRSLTNHCLDGRIVRSKSEIPVRSTLKFLLLNPASHFADIVKDARSVIVAGGTMQPITEFTDQLFLLAGGTPERISIFSCDHIIPENNILPIILSTGPTGKTLDFSFHLRNNLELLDELGRILLNISNVVPAGIVCFFPSYDYEHLVFQYLQKKEIIEKLEKKKKVLREPRKSSKVSGVLKMYEDAVAKQGALLFSVVGGKLSEGLNFNDDLGRCVIVFGLPYPNLTSPELKEKMNYLDDAMSLGTGKLYYANLCMKAVNQSIGRSIRHKNDYASVLLVDQRYSQPRCIESLPVWIKKSLHKEIKFGPAVGLLAKFFASKK